MPDTSLSFRIPSDVSVGGDRSHTTGLVLADDPTADAAIRAALTECGTDLFADTSADPSAAPDRTPEICCVALVGNDAYGAAAADPFRQLPRERVLAVARAMARRGRGRMVLVTDSGPQVHTGGSPERAAARAADLTWWRHLAATVAADGVAANIAAFGYAPFLGHTLSPGTESELLRHLVIRRCAEPADLTGVLGLLTSPGSSYLVGETIPLDGGMDLDFIPAPRPGVPSSRQPTTTPPGATQSADGPARRPVTLVVGASSGIGRAGALHVAAQGSDVVLTARRRAELDDVASGITELGRRAWVLPCDAADGDAVAALADQAWQIAGRVDQLLYAAGHLEFGSALTGPEAWDRTFAVNFGGYRILSAALVRRWIDTATPGAIAAVASVGSTSVPVAQVEAYGASKAAMVQYSRCLAATTARHGIRVNCVCPGIIETAMGQAAGPDFRDGWLKRIPAGRVGQPAEVAAVLGYLLSPAAAYLTGARLRVDGGYGLGGLPPLARPDGVLGADPRLVGEAR
ncbi:SDR family NAD(P)-dependent oxidoreductase [Catenulispora rubra]|uniref:SDR family NAD(P)-dependent oxidoreductase n=1 Tax=Catenulispora rubra TaxID=280293 RepID=UPI0018924A91|nr:SDR family NAD(P)-dependent oxidoreductase [Catenulispora rubra]